MKKEILFVGALALVLIGAYSLSQNRTPTVSNKPIETAALSPSSIASPIASSNIEVMNPKKGEKVTSPIIVMGNARVFENVVSVKLIDEAGNILGETTVTANSPDAGEFGPFQTQLNYSISQAQKGTLEAYQVSPEDGTEVDLVSIPLLLQ